jgi:hypothetical protein
MTINDNKENLGGKSCHLSQINDNKKKLKTKKNVICHKSTKEGSSTTN